MQQQFLHNIFSSFVLYFDHTLLKYGQAYTNTSGLFYPTRDDSLGNYYIASNPYKQMVFDSSITGAQIPSGIYVNNNFVPRGTSGLNIDFQQGRSIFTSGNPQGMISGNYAIKDFNIYTTTKSDQELIFNTRYVMNPEFPEIATGLGNKIVAPAIFLKLMYFDNTPFQFGGTNESNISARAIILGEDGYSIDGVGSIFSDQRYKNFKIFDQTPLNRFNDLKTGFYSYDDYSNIYKNNDYIYIENSQFSKYLGGPQNVSTPDIQVGFLNFKLKVARLNGEL